MKNKNKQKVAVIFLVFFAIIITCGVVNTVQSMKKEKKAVDKTYELISSGVYSSIKWLISKPVSASQIMAGDKKLIEILESEEDISDTEMSNKMSEYMSLMSKEMKVDYTYCTSDKTKKYYSSDGFSKIINPENDEHDEWYQRFVKSGKKYRVSIDTDQMNGDTWTVFVDSRIEDENGNLLGVCAAGDPIDGLQSILADYETKYKVKINFVDKNGIVKIDTNSVNIDNKDLTGIQYDNVDTNDKAYTYTAADGGKVVMRYVEEFGLYLVVRDKND